MYLTTVFAALILIVGALIASYIKKLSNHWKNRSIPHTPLNLFTTIKNFLFNRKHMAFTTEELYKEFSNERFFGSYLLIRPVVYIRDPHLIGNITIKDFDNFHDRFIDVAKNSDVDHHLVNLKGDHWKNIRAKLSPTFTSGKLKRMVDIMNSCGEILINQIEKNMIIDQRIAARETMARFATDVIGACAFGLEFSTIREPDSEYRKIGKKVMNPSFKSNLKSMISLTCPRLMILLKLSFVSQDVVAFFRNLLKRSEEIRKTEAIPRNDFVQLMLDIKEQEMSGDNKEDKNDALFDDKAIMSNMFLFFIAGFETSSVTLCYCLYELALHADIQNELRAEIIREKNEHDGKITYDGLKKMVLLEMIISEILRKYNPATVTLRVCSKKYQIPDSDAILYPGELVMIPIHAIHHDEKYYPEPDKFDPQRFSPENKAKLLPYTYIPFGDGPRMCIAERFARLEIKIALASLISRFKLEACDETPIPVTINPLSQSFSPSEEIFLRITPADS